MNKVICVDEADKELLWEIADWIDMYGDRDDLLLRECARRVCNHVRQEKLEIPTRYVSEIRRAFPVFCEACPEKAEVAKKLRKKLSDFIGP